MHIIVEGSFNSHLLTKKEIYRRFCTTLIIGPMSESNSEVWGPHKIGDIYKLESVQRNLTQFLPGVFNVPYNDRLERLGL